MRKINYKIREHSINKIPYILVLGDREIEENTSNTKAPWGLRSREHSDVDECIELIKRRGTCLQIFKGELTYWACQLLLHQLKRLNFM